PLETILGLPRYARSVVYHQFGEPCTAPMAQCRQEPVHLAVQMHVAQHFAAVSLYHASEIVDFVAPSQAPDESVRDQRRKPPGEPLVLSIFAPAAHDIVAGCFLELRNQAWDV